MSNLLTKFVIGFIHIMTLWGKTVEGQEKCSIQTDDGMLSVDCSARKISGVPQQLSQSIKVLDISDNDFEESLNENVFKRYPELTILRMGSLRSAITARDYVKHDERVFVPLKRLEVLELSESKFTGDPKFIWPASLKKLRVRSIRLTKLNLVELTLLEELNAANNMLTGFPALHPEAPVTFIDLSQNPLSDIKAENLAPYCRLSYLGMQVTPGGALARADHYCQCKRLEHWMLIYGIDGYSPCFRNTFETPLCDMNFSVNSINERRVCLDRLPLSPILKLIIFAVCISVICPCLYLMTEIYKKIKVKKDEANAAEADAAAAAAAEEVGLEEPAEEETAIGAEEGEGGE